MKQLADLDQHQRAAVEYLKYRTGSLVALPIGFGKTVVCLTAIKEILNVHPEWRVLVLSTKAIVQYTWGQEIADWEHLRELEYAHNNGRDPCPVLKKPQVLGVNFENTEWLLDLFDQDQSLMPEILVIDESSKMKAHDAKRVQRLAGLRRVSKKGGVTHYQNYPGYVSKFKRRFLLSGTPAPEGYADLWAQSTLLSKRRQLGENVSSFRKQYCSRSFNGFGFRVTPAAQKEIEHTLRYTMYTPEVDDVLGLEPTVHRAVEAPWTDEAREEYEKMEDDFVFVAEKELKSNKDVSLDEIEVEAPNSGVLLSKLRQMASGFVYQKRGPALATLDPHAKGDALERIIDSSADVPLLVFNQFTEEADYLIDRFGFERGLPKDLDRWSSKQIRPGLVLHPASAGHGINLQHGSHICVYYSMPYSGEQWQQSWGRLARRGQERPVSAIRIERPSSVCQDVWASVQAKDATLKGFLRRMRQRRAENR